MIKLDQSFIFVLTLFLFSPFLSAQDSRQKENILSARKTARDARENKEHCDKLGFPASAGDNRCFVFYPSDLLTWGRGFSDDRAKITLRGKAGYINKNGKVVIPARFKDAGRFSEGLAPFESKAGKWGYIDTMGKVVIKPTFDWAVSFNEGLALVQVGEVWGYIDRNGTLKVKPQFEEAGSFSEGTAVVSWYDEDIEWMGATPGKGRRVSRFIDKTGAWAIDKSFDGISRGFDGGMAIVSRNLGYSEKYQGMMSETYIIDTSGRELWKLDSATVSWFSDDAIVVEIERLSQGGSLDNFKDRRGNILCGREYQNAGGFSEGLSSVRVNRKYGFINKQCEFVIEPQFSDAKNFSEGLAWVKESSGRNGFIDKTGNWVVDTRFEWVGSFSGGFALVLDGDKAGYIDRNGKVIWHPTK